MKRDHIVKGVKIKTVFVLLIVLLLPIYSNTFQSSFQFDDKQNIVTNKKIHLDKLSPDSLWDTVFAKPGRDEFYRPLPMLSFALNWYFGKADTFGYHVVNVVIHTLTAFILFLTTFSLLHTPIAKRNYQTEDAYFISILSAALWAINPIQIQAVTYIVQRMTTMAALFYILGIYLYIQGRQATRAKIQILFFIACFFSFVSAMMSKENAAMLPVSLFLIEIIFFENKLWVKYLKDHIPVWVGAGFFLAFLGIFIVYKGYLNFLFDSYESRSFSIAERLFSEPRIVLFYISQIFYPLPERLSIVHDIIISKSLLSPWTTLPAILIVLLLTRYRHISDKKKTGRCLFNFILFFKPCYRIYSSSARTNL